MHTLSLSRTTWSVSPACYGTTITSVVRDLELLPCRLSEMVVSEKVVLKRLMPPLVEALRCSEGLVTLALHTLEYWVDSLNPEFLEPAMLPVIGELMRALWTHLRPVQDSQFGAKVGLPLL